MFHHLFRGFNPEQSVFVLISAAEKAPAANLFDQKASAGGFEQQKQQQPVKVVYYRALYPFDARSHDEISIQPGDVIMVRKVTHLQSETQQL